MKERRPPEDPENQLLWERVTPETRNAGLALVRAWGSLFRWVEPHFRRFGLSQPKFAALMTLRRSSPDGISLTELAQSVYASNANMTGLVARLSREGLVERRRNPDDGRSWLVRMTAKGRARLERVWERHPIMLEAVFGGLDAGEKREMARLLGKFTASVSNPEAVKERSRS